jgi:hypothetical protein
VLTCEGDLTFQEPDPVLQKILVERAIRYHTGQPADHARFIRKYLMIFIEMGDRERAIRLCKRYLSIQKSYIDNDWPDLSQKIQQTEALLYQLQFGSLDDFKNLEKSLRVSVSLTAPDGSKSPRPQSPANQPFDYDAFMKEKMPGKEFAKKILPEGKLASLQNADGTTPIFRECIECGELMLSKPKLVPSAGYITAMAFSGMLVPFVVGIIPFAILATKRPCQNVQHYCSECGKPIDE